MDLVSRDTYVHRTYCYCVSPLTTAHSKDSHTKLSQCYKTGMTTPTAAMGVSTFHNASLKIFCRHALSKIFNNNL